MSKFPEVDVKEEEKQRTIHTPVVVGPDFLAEETWDGHSLPRYVIRRFNKEGVSYVGEVSLGEVDERGRPIVYRPVYNDQLRKGLVTVPREPKPTSFKAVIGEVFEFLLLDKHFDAAGGGDLVKLFGMIAMGTWFLDRMAPKTKIPVAGVGRFAPIIAIRGPSGSGKNRLGNLLRFVSYRPYFDLSKSRIPSLFRPLDLWKGTLVMDEADFYKTGETSELIHFLNSRATGTPISRQNPDNPKVGEAFESFGLTIVTQRRYFDDNATEDRVIPFYSEKTTRRMPTVELDETVEEGMDLQDKLLYLRLKHWPEFQIDKEAWIEGLTDARLNAALLPVLAIGRVEPQVMQIVEAVVKPIEEAKRRIKANSEDGIIVNVLWDKLDVGLFSKWNQYYYVVEEVDVREEGKEGEEKTRVETHIPLTTSNLKDRLTWSARTIRKVLASLHVAPDNAPDRIRLGNVLYRPVFFDPSRMEKRLREFVVGYETWALYEKLSLSVPVVPLVPDVQVSRRAEPADGDTHGEPVQLAQLAQTGLDVKPPPSVSPETEDVRTAKPGKPSERQPPQPEQPAQEKMAMVDLLPILRCEWASGYKEDFLNMVVEKGGWPRDKAKQLFDQQVKEKKILRDPDGFWRWV